MFALKIIKLKQLLQLPQHDLAGTQLHRLTFAAQGRPVIGPMVITHDWLLKTVRERMQCTGEWRCEWKRKRRKKKNKTKPAHYKPCTKIRKIKLLHTT